MFAATAFAMNGWDAAPKTRRIPPREVGLRPTDELATDLLRVVSRLRVRGPPTQARGSRC